MDWWAYPPEGMPRIHSPPFYQRRSIFSQRDANSVSKIEADYFLCTADSLECVEQKLKKKNNKNNYKYKRK